MHRSTYEKTPVFLFLDKKERVVELPTLFMRGQAELGKALSAGTLTSYAQKLQSLCEYLESTTLGAIDVDTSIRFLKLRELDRYYRNLVTSGLAVRTIRSHESVIRKFTNWLASHDAGHAHADPIYGRSGYRTASPPRSLPRYLTSSQVIKLMLNMRYEEQRLAVQLIYDTGLRVSELPRVLCADLPTLSDYPAAQMYFPLLVRGSKGRGGALKYRYTIISRPMVQRLHRHHNAKSFRSAAHYAPSEKPALLNTHGSIWTVKALQGCIDKARRRSGLPAASAHRLRHGTAYSVLKSEHGKNLADKLVVLQRLLGHSDLATTEMYANIPAPVLQGFVEGNDDASFRYRFEEAQDVFDKTFLLQKHQPAVKKIGSA